MYEYQTNLYETDECIAKGICNINPTVSSIQEIILLYVRELSFYILKLKEFEVTNDLVKNSIIETFFTLITNVEYNQEQFHNIISQLYNYINQSKFLYEKICTEKNVPVEINKSYFKYAKAFNLTDAIKKGEKYFLKRTHTYTPKQKDLYDIVIFLEKSIIIKIIELQRLDKSFDKAYYTVLSLLNAVKPSGFAEEKIKKEIEKAIEVYHEIIKLVYSTQIELYGHPRQVEVNFSTTVGKAILVSGSDFKKLVMVLEAAKGYDIDIYTHGLEMLMAHSFPKINSYSNLKGHFGTELDNSLIDFASFPGPILMTKGTLLKVEYLYRGRLFTLDPIAPQGVVRIKDNNFEPLIKSALESKGFINVHKRNPMKVGFINTDIDQRIDDIIDKISKGEIKHLYIIGLLNAPNPAYRSYFDEFLKLLQEDSYVFSLCCPVNTDRVYHLDSFFDYSLFYKILDRLDKGLDLNTINISIFLTRCDKHFVSNLLYLKHRKIKNVYMCKCPLSLISPSLVETLQKSFEIKNMSVPQQDIDDTLKG